ncbi:MAG: Ig-like domain-containing protein [Lachnospiraceae bacterium]|nr:Ig-like domain-containing protein [Lachnospiraceae bacterium]
MKKENNNNQYLKPENLEDTLEFLSLDDETIEAYNRTVSMQGGKSIKTSNIEDDIEEEYDDEDEEDIEDIEDIEEYDDEDVEDIEEYDDEDVEDIEEYDDEDIEDIEYIEDFDEDYDEEDYEEDEEDEEDVPRGGFIPRVIYFVKNMSSIDRVVAILGLFIIVAGIITGTLYVDAKSTSKKVEAFAEIGSDIEGIGIIGESGLIAVSDAEAARLSQMIEPEQEQEEEKEVKDIEVAINITSIQSDIKIKFVNKENNKLIANVPFEVEVTGSKSKAFNLKDEDKDGIIYQTDVDADTYTVKPLELKGEEFEGYKFAAKSETIKVTDTIAYKKVDVADEIKSEAEVNAAAEDTAQQTQTESSLTDTVEWVESTKTEIESDENYLELNKSDIPDPSTSAMVGTGMAGFMKLVETGTENKTEEQTSDEGDDTNGGAESQDKPKTDKEKLEALKPSLTPSSVNIKKGESVSLIFTTEVNASYVLDWSSSNTSVAYVDEDGTITGVGAGSATVSAIIKLDSSSSASVTLNCSVTVTEDTPSAPAAPTYKMKSVTGGGNIKVGQTCTVSGTTEPEGGKITWSSSNTKIATVDANGVVTGVSTGAASIIGTSESGDSKECTVTVEASEITYKSVTITGSSTIEAGKSATLKAATDPAGGSVSWSSDNEKVVKIDSSGNMTGVSAGSATITATCGSAKGTLKVTVTKGKDVSGDTKTKLKDKKGNQIYIKNSDGKYVEATYADYYKSSKFYLKSPNVKYRYTGWQTIDGYTYFFDKNGNYVTGEQVIQGAKYTFGSDGRLSSGSGTMGIDVSKHNGTIDWNAVKNSGVSFAIIRCGYRGSATGVLVEDPMFRSNIKGAKAAGIKVGVYFFCQAVNEVEAVEEASMAVSLVSGYGLDMPIFLDVESAGGRGDRISKDTRTAVCRAFCQTVQNSGYSAGIYANKTWFNEMINTASLTNYKIWLAQYASAPTYTKTRYDIWQYSSKGRINGIKGDVDLDIRYY